MTTTATGDAPTPEGASPLKRKKERWKYSHSHFPSSVVPLQRCVNPLGGSRHGKQRRLCPLLVTPFFGRQLPESAVASLLPIGCFAQTAFSLSFSLLLACALLYLLCSALLSFAWLGFPCFALPLSTTLHFALPSLALLYFVSPCLALLSWRVLLRSAHTTPAFEAARYLAALSCLGICALSTQQCTGDGSSRG